MIPDPATAAAERLHTVFCNYQDGPIGGYGCVCQVVNKNEQAATLQRLADVESLAKRLIAATAVPLEILHTEIQEAPEFYKVLSPALQKYIAEAVDELRAVTKEFNAWAALESEVGK